MKTGAILLAAALMSAAAATSTAATTTLRPGVTKLTRHQAHMLQSSGQWHPGCPVMPYRLRILTAPHWGFDHRAHLGQIVINEAVTGQVTKAFRELYALHFPIRVMSFDAVYGPTPSQSGDVTASFECRDAVPSPCNGNTKGTSWSMHAYGEAIDLDPRENPYVGCGMTRDKTAISYMDRSNVRPGMITPGIYRKTFATVGWGWGGLWSGSTKDYMHVSVNGH
ncbi:MAG: hypothetical protein QOG85_1882 [Gaiellaceae bacterium]|jgi:hypothetical protein|nr:hypothetical protein [Gaiellaceae bacterium]